MQVMISPQLWFRLDPVFFFIPYNMTKYNLIYVIYVE